MTVGFYDSIKEKLVEGRYVTLEHLAPYLKRLPGKAKLTDIGKSVLGKEIYAINLGKGKCRILMWSQMHGNESTTTKAILDLINYLCSSQGAHNILENCTLTIVPILNPDGAAGYTRVNANAIDLNRDAKELSQPESRSLLELYQAFEPDFCFNLHDQRTLYNVGNSSKPATLSFLAPAHDQQRSISPSRAVSMQLIAGINKKLQTIIPGQVGRYDDGFNPNCVGDGFQMLGTPTLLFEAGHFQGDYQRERTRELVFISLLEAIELIANDTIESHLLDDYFLIPENNKLFFDILVRNAQLINPKFTNHPQVGINYKEVLNDNSISFVPELSESGELNANFGHSTLDCALESDLKQLQNLPEVYKLLI